MIFENLKQKKSIDDNEFNQIYPTKIKNLAVRQWTPVKIARKAADFLVDRPNTKVLDIGSGVGKFCLVGAACTKGMFHGAAGVPNKVIAENSRKI